MHLAPGDPDAMARVAGFLQGLQEQGWATDRNIQIDYRWAVGQAELYRKHAAELVALQPDVLVTTVTDAVRALQQSTRTIPIVFTSVIDPVGSGLITSLSHPGGNATGFSLFEFGISGKWLELLKQIAPSVARVAVLRDSASTRGVGQFALFKPLRQPSVWSCVRSMRKKEAKLIVPSAISLAEQIVVLLSLQARPR